MNRNDATLNHGFLVEELVDKINVELNVPLIDEGQEAKCIRWIVDSLLQVVPEEYLQMFAGIIDGVSAAEAKYIKRHCVQLLNAKIDIPWMSERAEEMIFAPVVSNLVDTIIDQLGIEEDGTQNEFLS